MYVIQENFARYAVRGMRRLARGVLPIAYRPKYISHFYCQLHAANCQLLALMPSRLFTAAPLFLCARMPYFPGSGRFIFLHISINLGFVNSGSK
jgi:hypothetical protein